MYWDISLHTGLEFVKKVFTKLRDERKQLDFNYRYFENVLIITFCAYSIIYKYKEGEEIGLLEMEWGVLPSYLKHATEQETVAAK